MTDPNYLLSIDPGGSSACVLLSYSPENVPEVVKAFQFDCGAEGMREWLGDSGPLVSLPEHWKDFYGAEGNLLHLPNLTIICEAFTARATKGFSYTTASLEALPVIGVLVGRGLVNRKDKKRYVDPKFQYLVGGKDLVDKKKRQHAFLEDSGYYIGRKEIGRTLKDYDDARSATAHGLAWLARNGHKKTFDMISEWSEAHG